MDNLSYKSNRAMKWSFITEIIAKLVSPITNMILARLLLPEAFGAVATMTMIISFAEVFTDAGFQKYIVQHEFKDEKDYDQSVNVAFWSNLSLSVIATLAIFVFKDPLANLVGSPNLGWGIAISSLSIILVAFSSIQIAVYRRQFHFKTLFFVRILISIIPLIVTIPLAIWLRNYWALVIGTLIMNLVQAVTLIVKSKWKIRLYYSFSKLKEMLSFSTWSLLEAISIWLTSYIGTFLVGRSLNDYYLGLYKTSMTTVNSYMAIITAAITPVVFSTLSRMQNNPEEFKAYYFKIQKLTALFIIPMGVGLFVYRELVTKILLGNEWTEAANFIGLWGLMGAFTIVYSNFASEVYRSKGLPKTSLITQLIHLAFLIPTIVISLNYDFETLYIARSFIRIQGILSALIVLHFFFQIRIGLTLLNTLPQITCATIMGLAGYGMLLVSNHFIWQLFSILICIAIYSAAIMCVPSLRHELLPMLKKLLNKKQK